MIEFSWSALKDYRRCPFLYQQKHVLAVKGTDDDKQGFFGVWIQKLVEEFYTERWWKSPDPRWMMQERADELFRMMTDGGNIRWSVEERTALTARMTETIPVVLDTIKREKLLTPKVYPEVELYLDFFDWVPESDEVIRLHGRADFIVEDHGLDKELIVLDGKSGASHASPDQLRFYALAMEQTRPFLKRPAAAAFWRFRKGELEWKPLTVANLRRCREAIKETVTAILSGSFDPTPSAYCGRCAWRCAAGRQHGLSRTSKVRIDGGNTGTVSF